MFRAVTRILAVLTHSCFNSVPGVLISDVAYTKITYCPSFPEILGLLGESGGQQVLVTCSACSQILYAVWLQYPVHAVETWVIVDLFLKATCCWQ